jgi:hypothetical protein
MAADEDKRREEVECLLRRYAGRDEKALEALLAAFMLLSYPTKKAQNC